MSLFNSIECWETDYEDLCLRNSMRVALCASCFQRDVDIQRRQSPSCLSLHSTFVEGRMSRKVEDKRCIFGVQFIMCLQSQFTDGLMNTMSV